MNEEKIITTIKENLKDKVLEITNPSPRRIFLKVDKNNLCEAISTIKEKLGFTYLITITGLDKTDSFELLYHFADDTNVINIRVAISRENPIVSTVTGVIPGAILYEREIQDMFGIKVENIPDPRPLITPDDWPEGAYPLRKDWKYERPGETIPGGK
ncbi:MAG: NADH-quinone oxidoreductase subunit C [bacterium]|nr:NADH-quinone oxidoreductase subunit C [bacterium]